MSGYPDPHLVGWNPGHVYPNVSDPAIQPGSPQFGHNPLGHMTESFPNLSHAVQYPLTSMSMSTFPHSYSSPAFQSGIGMGIPQVTASHPSVPHPTSLPLSPNNNSGFVANPHFPTMVSPGIQHVLQASPQSPTAIPGQQVLQQHHVTNFANHPDLQQQYLLQHQQLQLQFQQQQQQQQYQTAGFEPHSPRNAAQNSLHDQSIYSPTSPNATHMTNPGLQQKAHLSPQVYVQTQHQNEALDDTDAMPQRPAPPHTYIPEPLHPNRKSLPYSLPTTLNPSLQLKSGDLNQNTTKSVAQNVTNPVPPPGTGYVKVTWDSQRSDGHDDQTTSGRGSSISSSETGSSPTSPNLGRVETHWADYGNACYAPPADPDNCLRCHQKVYAMERIGPIKGVLYHKLCFTCIICGTKLNLKNFQHNPNDMDDLNVFCLSHRPRDRGPASDANAVQIKAALGVPRLERVNEQIRGEKYASGVVARRPSAYVVGTSNNSPAWEPVYYGMSEHERSMAQQASFPDVNTPQQHQQQQQTASSIALQQKQTASYAVLQQQQTASSAVLQQQQTASSAVPQQTAPIPPPATEQTKSEKSVEQNQISSPNECDGEGLNTSLNGSKASSGIGSHQDDDVFRRQDSWSDKGKHWSPGSSILSSSSLSRPDRPSMESVTQAMAEQLTLDSTDGSRVTQMKDGQSQTDAPTKVIVVARADRPSNHSSRSGSPVHMRLASDASDGPASARSSISSFSRQNSEDLRGSTSSLSRPHNTSMERADRPSTSSLGDGSMPPSPISAIPKSAAARMMIKSSSSHELYNNRVNQDPRRVLTRNESMRMDRPSQYS